MLGSGHSESQEAFGWGMESTTRNTPFTISSIYVKSRSISPLLKTFIGRLCKIASVNKKGDISGLPHGPYTVKKRSPVEGISYK